MFIYIITNKINGKQYVGQTTESIGRRWSGHLSNAKRLNYPICKAIRKYGADNFTINEIVIADSLDKLNVLEPLYIDLYNTLQPNGYNLNSGGKNCFLHPETKVKISVANKGKPGPNKGKKMSDETKAKMVASKKGKPLLSLRGIPKTPEHRAKLSFAKMGKLGVLHTAEFKTKMIGNKRGEVNKGIKKPDEWKAFMSEFSRKRERKTNGQFEKYL